MERKAAFERFMNEYGEAKQQDSANNPLASFVRTDIPHILYDLPFTDQKEYLIIFVMSDYKTIHI